MPTPSLGKIRRERGLIVHFCLAGFVEGGAGFIEGRAGIDFTNQARAVVAGDSHSQRSCVVGRTSTRFTSTRGGCESA